MYYYLVQDEKELLDNNCCPVHLKPCVSRKEDNYFFALSKYQKALEETLNKNPNFVQPSFRLNEVRQWGLCFSIVFLSVTFLVWCTLCWLCPILFSGHTLHVYMRRFRTGLCDLKIHIDRMDQL